MGTAKKDMSRLTTQRREELSIDDFKAAQVYQQHVSGMDEMAICRHWNLSRFAVRRVIKQQSKRAAEAREHRFDVEDDE